MQAAKDRRLQLGVQLPLYDLDEEEHCSVLPDKELQHFQSHLQHVRLNVVGQGAVAEVHLAPKLLVPGPTFDADSNSLTNNNLQHQQQLMSTAVQQRQVPVFTVRDNTKIAGRKTEEVVANKCPLKTGYTDDPPPSFNEFTHPQYGNHDQCGNNCSYNCTGNHGNNNEYDVRGNATEDQLSGPLQRLSMQVGLLLVCILL